MFTEERALWLFQHFLWLERHLPKRREGKRSPLILPTAQFYPQRNTRDHAFVESIFDSTRAFMDISEWPCLLRPQSDATRDLAARAERGAASWESRTTGAAGTFSVGEQVKITYSPSLIANPPALVATLAHELCHYLMLKVTEEPPAGWAEHEPLTDLAAVQEGFGVFLCNTAFQFGQWSTATHGGWSTGTRGYLNTTELGFSLAVFCVLNEVDPEPVMKHLKPNPAEVFWDAIPFVEDLVKSDASGRQL